MTLIIAAQGNGFVILAADSRGTIQDIANNRMQVNLMIKLYEITERAGFLVAGAGGQAIYLLEQFKKQLKNPKENVSKITDDFVNFCRTEFKKLKDVPLANLPSFVFVISGLDKLSSNVLPQCYSISSDMGFIPESAKHGYIIKGKPMIAEYLFSKYYKKSKDSVNDLCELVALAMDDTIGIDGDVGGEIHMAIIDKDGFRPFSNDDVESFLKKDESDSD